MRDLPWPARVYLVAVIGAAVALMVRSVMVSGAPVAPEDLDVLLVLALLFLVCESMPTLLNVEQFAVSVSFSASLAAVVLIGPEGAAVVGLTAMVSVRPGLPLIKRLFNGAQFAICGYVAGRVYESLHGQVGVPQVNAFDDLIGPYAAAMAVFVPLNIALTLTMIGLATRVRATEVPLRGMAQFLLSYLGYGTFGLLVAGLWATVQSISAVLVLLPLFVARWAFGQYHAQQRSYDATIAALCQAVETKDYYTRGHCTRVSLASSMIAQEIGMGPERVRAIRYAGMLHDVGKLGVPTKVLQKDGPLTEEEFAAIQLHPMRGLEIVRGIGFLDEAYAGIMHHHERHDGTGYPMGLAGDEIPEFAKVIAVADAFDSMTSDRSYRGARPVAEALDELRKTSGTHFDPVMVAAFIRVLDREPWQPPRKVEAPPPDETPIKDHDDPTMPIEVVTGQ
ncbi:HD-GYP domain-containing protein [Nonomuraea angiospora]|uniref:HD-GYP domain-containing protein (C-di-GMP phosphodiesterase class II) n=1 Tax=Nonomuraea angiospora TaxID=46172 RepID=A0ABR9M4J2_9ACTN|nr:HD-GYP domain-containing protein [Nonomuraea angiospora]MBE1587443.1 HD-GYP domain-containing protein (c-di-GMP phosphodiesterase class II) [Nonomuraea angiospora]MDX3105152.1 HD-GYP domain-containing protein [Nonomuraea angiospora]